MDMLSVVIPAFNEEQTVMAAAREVSDVLAQAEIPFELIFVDDGSIDGTWAQIQQLSGSDARIRGIHFSRNFGKDSAIMAGLAASAGNCCAVMDCDLQHPPEKLPEMYALWKQGYEIVEGRKRDRGQESAAYGFAAGSFYRIISAATGIAMRNASDFKLLDRKVVLALLNMREKGAFFRAMSAWVGFRSAVVEFDVGERVAGTTKWSTGKLIRYAMSNISSFSTLPMQVVTGLGLLMFLVSCVFGVIALVQKILGTALGGFTTVILLQLFIGSIMMISLGIIGYYIARIYEEVQGRPRYIVADSCGDCADRNENTNT